MAIKELTQEEISFVSGGGNAGDHDRSNNNGSGSSSKSGNGGFYSSVDSCGAGILGGLVAGSLGGPLGMTAGMLGGAIAGQCTVDSFSNKSDSNKQSHDYAGQCTW